MSGMSFFIIAISFLSIIAILSVIIKKGRQYDMKLFFTGSFGVLWVGLIIAMCAYKFVTPVETAEIASIISLLLGIVASAYLNIKKSNIAFGILYTATQTFMFVFSFMVIFLIFLKLKKEI